MPGPGARRATRSWAVYPRSEMDNDEPTDRASFLREAKFSIFGLSLLGFAWLLGHVIVVSWPLALLSCAIQICGLVHGSTPGQRRSSAFTLGTTLLLIVLPIWGSHLGEPPRPGRSEDLVPHTHPIWELGHVH